MIGYCLVLHEKGDFAHVDKTINFAINSMTFDKLINIKLSICVYLVGSERKHK